ncbi:ornithine cyclodeaminase family protein [Nocardia abscessus]|uniref:ornithine cyclodeaminase family protein n=1 Tax=Nocardia abscessus TaxID=120957 RepID=UPI00245384CD|nr:ornithine cyclodeaminase family protein [Nocardia abscessus]
MLTVSTNSETAPRTRYLSADDVEKLAGWEAIAAALRQAYAQPIAPEMAPPRSIARADGIWMRGLSAVSPSRRHVGAKLITVATASRKASYLVVLFDANSAELVALIDGNHLTALRTAATSAMAADLLTATAEPRVAVIGAGLEATNHLAAVAHLRALGPVKVFSPTPQRRRDFAARAAREYGLDATAVDSASEAVTDADLVICAARSRDESPTLLGEWLTPGATVVSIGSTIPEQREVDATALGRADVIVADMVSEVLDETGDCLAATAAGFDLADKTVSLADVAAGRAPGRTDPQQIVIYKSVGSALQDVVLAELLLDQAVTAGVGINAPAPIQAVQK